MNWKMFWLGAQADSTQTLQEDIDTFAFLKNYKVGFRANTGRFHKAGSRGNPRRYYVVSNESAEYVIEQLRKAGYQVLEITNYD